MADNFLETYEIDDDGDDVGIINKINQNAFFVDLPEVGNSNMTNKTKRNYIYGSDCSCCDDRLKTEKTLSDLPISESHMKSKHGSVFQQVHSLLEHDMPSLRFELRILNAGILSSVKKYSRFGIFFYFSSIQNLLGIFRYGFHGTRKEYRLYRHFIPRERRVYAIVCKVGRLAEENLDSSEMDAIEAIYDKCQNGKTAITVNDTSCIEPLFLVSCHFN